MSDNDFLLIGNVRFNKEDIKSTSVKQDADGDNIYSVFLKNGTQIKFRDQEADSHAQVTTGYDQGNGGKYGTAFSGIVGLSIQGSNKDDYYHLYNCDYYYMDVTSGGKDEVRVVNTDGEPEDATIEKDSSDNVYNVDTSKGISRSEGWFTRNKVAPDNDVVNRDNEVVNHDNDENTYNLPQPLANAKDIPEKSRLRDPFYFQFVKDGDIFDGAFGYFFTTREERADGPVLRRNVTEEEDGSLTYVGADLARTPVKVNVKHNPDGTTMLKITESTRTEPNKIQIVDTETGTLLYDKFDGTQTFYNADGSQSLYDENNVLLHKTRPFEHQ